jgi:hypothetical protein
MDPVGKFLFAMDGYYGSVFVFTIDPNTGAPTQVPNSPFYVANHGDDLFVLDSTGQFAYSLSPYNFNGDNNPRLLSASSIDRNSGALTPVPGSPFTIPNDPAAVDKNGPNPSWATANPIAGFLFVADKAQLDFWTFTIDQGIGAPTLSSGSPLHMPQASNRFVINPAGNFAHFTTSYPNSTDCSIYYPYTDVYAPDSLFAYAVTTSRGTLTSHSNPHLPAAGYSPYPIAFEPSGRFAYVLNLQGYNFDPNSSNISAYGIDGRSGNLRPVLGSPFPAGAYAAQTLVVTPGMSQQ